MTIADRQRLTRRDRAACMMALVCSRRYRRVPFTSAVTAADWSMTFAYPALTSGGEVALAISDAMAAPGLWRERRARLALLLRAILRADAGDYGPSRYTPEALAYLGMSGDQMIAHGRFVGPTDTRRIAPLWERARAHEASK